jgi:hypothetical protein
LDDGTCRSEPHAPRRRRSEVDARSLPIIPRDARGIVE